MTLVISLLLLSTCPLNPLLPQHSCCPSYPWSSYVLHIFRYFKVLIQELDVEMDKGWLLELVDLFGNYNEPLDVCIRDTLINTCTHLYTFWFAHFMSREVLNLFLLIFEIISFLKTTNYEEDRKVITTSLQSLNVSQTTSKYPQRRPQSKSRVFNFFFTGRCCRRSKLLWLLPSFTSQSKCDLC